ncbi:hypothetical protein AABC73_29180 (plasmid) [Pseudomonas sp. G.S.17]|uniref:hypothetical protein n=1 Tax=Pseudomonas sp. G.S.17 TaxID=3137451 RepID=UPI00311CA702
MSSPKSIFGFMDTIPFTVGAAVWFALFSMTIDPISKFQVTIMFVNVALSAGYAGRTAALFMRFLEHGRTAVTKTPENVTE